MNYNINSIKLTVIIFLTFFAITFFPTQAKAQWDYQVDVTVKKGKKKLEGATGTLYKGTTLVQQVLTPANGKFSLKLDPNAEYTLSISKPGYITKKFSFNTRGVPDDRAKEPFGGSMFDVSIFEMPKDPAVVSQINSILGQPMAKFLYNDTEKEFSYDKGYTQSIQDALAKLSQIEEAANKKAEEEAKKTADLESAAASQYQAAIAKGDAAFAKKDYTTARAGYTDALAVKPGEAYPKGKIIEIEKLIADASKNAQVDADYKAAITKADAAFNAKDFTNAKIGYNDALKLKSAEAYPKTKLAEIDAAMAKLAAEKDLNAKYDAAIVKGDKALSGKTYDAAKAAYNEAIALKATEKYPKDKITEIDKILAELANKEKSEKELNDKYNAAIAKGDKALTSKDYVSAKAGYTEALTFKSAEAYPKTKLAEIDKALADIAAKDAAEKDKLAKEKELNDKYNAAIKKGDAALAAKTYDPAKSAYNEALALKATEQYPKDKIAEINKILADIAAKDAADKDKLAKEKELNDKYNAAISKADKALTAKDYTTAKGGYNEALALKASEQYPKDKLSEIEKLLADLAAKNAAEKDKLAKEKELNDKYIAAIAKGDKALAAKTYDAAKSGYNEALGFKPNEQYPKDKLSAIDKILADLASKDAAEKERQAKEKELNDKYTAAVAKADKALTAKSYDEAKTGYNEALALKSAEVYPKTKLAEIDKLLADAAAKDKAEKDRLAKEKELAEKYTAAIAKADAAFGTKDYSAAKVTYTEASGYKASEQYPKDKIKEIDAILAKELGAKALEEKYNAAISKGDKALTAKDYVNAKAGYNEALSLKASEKYPKDKLTEIEKLLADIAAKNAAEMDKAAKAAELEAKYKAAIAKGDAALKLKTYDAAKTAYNEGLNLKAAEQYPKDKIAEIDALIAKDMGAKELDEKYKAAVGKADKALAAKLYEEAKSGYNEALALKSAEAYPKTKLAEIDKLLADATAKDKAEKDRLAKEKELAEKYATAISKADAAFGTKDYTGAKAAYTEASGYKASEQYPKDKIAEINAILAKEMGAKALEEKYNAAILKADKALTAKDYVNAKSGYIEALSVKPNEQYPKDKLSEVDKALADAAAEKDKAAKAAELEAKYKAAIAKGDAALKLKTYDAAKTAYNEALNLKTAEQYPKDKIAEIDALIAKDMGAKELDEKYKAAVAKADKALAAKSYDEAKSGYNEALALKSAEAYPKTKLAEIDKLLADAAAKDKAEKDRLAKEKELAEKYATAISKADAALGTKDYTGAKAAYTEASGYKASEQYPKDKIAEINAILAKEMGTKELEKKYAEAIAKGDAALASKDYTVAKTQYIAGSSLKPTEQYPKDKLSEIEKALAEIAASKDKDAAQKALDAKYAAAIAKGDKAFTAKTYDAAKTAYNEALGLKSTEQYPKDKLSEIEKVLAEIAASKNKDAAQKALDAKYATAITKADAAFAIKNYEAAKAGYNEALGIKPDEKYPQDKLAAIDALILNTTNAKANEEKYKAAIIKADGAFARKDYAAAKISYTDALGLKTTEQYPKDQLTKLVNLLGDLEKNRAVQEKYDAAVKKADGLLAEKKYNEAILAFKDAQSIKINEPYPANKISEINKTIDDLARSKEKDQQYKDLIAKGDKLFASKDYKLAKSAFQDALLIKATEKYPKDKIAAIDVLLKNKNATTTTVVDKKNKDEFKSELAKKYPEGITEEQARESNCKITRRIVVRGNEGHLYIKKETNFGPVYFFKDEVPITEQEFIRDTEQAQQ